MKKYLIGIFLAFFATTAAFSLSETTQNVVAVKWFELMPGGNPSNPNDYIEVTAQPCDGSSTTICGVQANEDPGNPGHPDFTQHHTYVYREL